MKLDWDASEDELVGRLEHGEFNARHDVDALDAAVAMVGPINTAAAGASMRPPATDNNAKEAATPRIYIAFFY